MRRPRQNSLGILERRVDLGKKTKECDALSAKIGKLEEELATHRDAPKANEEKIGELEFRVSLNAKAFAHLMTLVKDHSLSSLWVAGENDELRRKVNYEERKALEAVSLAERLQAMASAMAEELDSSTAKFEELALEDQCMPGLVGYAKSQCEYVAVIEEASRTKALGGWTKYRTMDMEVVAE